MVKKKKPVKKPAGKKRAKAKAKRPPAKKAAKKTVKKTAKKPAKKPVRKKPLRKKKAAPTVSEEQIFVIAPELEARLHALAVSMDKTFDAILLQALMEFANTWEDHQRTVAALGEEDDRMQLVVPQE